MKNPQQDIEFMRQAMALAQKAQDSGEVPVGALLVADGQVIAEGFNQVIQAHDPSAHAEMVALRAGGQALQNYRLLDTTLYVTLEPCPMCAGALLHGRVKRIVFGAFDQKAGAAGSVLNLFASQAAYHYAEIEGGVLEDECRAQLQQFFKQRRAAHKANKDAKRQAQSELELRQGNATNQQHGASQNKEIK
ncbi:tRNA-specific adenosine deaminase [Vibrio stylophorae]|uniref:tRNA-specific adenosine deaminase n=1 Tax=Vibrio stylophorae TaxID=659351 RepID=A0ABN8DS83_9VIBR|nr:tRNA adenosine(34) deaminase TadA [Vibrio stylophorae]CAH0532882.1 tRNA-specific adenosine deaminase [Vibrio stylophorae]